MANETLNHLVTLRAVNKAPIDALGAAVCFSDKVEQIPEEQRKSMVKSLNALIAQSGAAYGESPTRH
jgi:hypothetical protein